MIDVTGVQATIRKAFEIGEGDPLMNTTDADRAYIALRRALAFMIRGVAFSGTPHQVIVFSREVTNPVFLRDPAKGEARMTELVEMPIARDLPVEVWAHASDVFNQCIEARESTMNRPPTEDDIGSHARNVLQLIELAPHRVTAADGSYLMLSDAAAIGAVDRLNAIVRLAEGPPIAADVTMDDVVATEDRH